MTVYDKLLTILDGTSSEVLDDMWEENVSLDQIAAELLDEHARELGVES